VALDQKIQSNGAAIAQEVIAIIRIATQSTAKVFCSAAAIARAALLLSA
jgi:hypothetical protein